LHIIIHDDNKRERLKQKYKYHSSQLHQSKRFLTYYLNITICYDSTVKLLNSVIRIILYLICMQELFVLIAKSVVYRDEILKSFSCCYDLYSTQQTACTA